MHGSCHLACQRRWVREHIIGAFLSLFPGDPSLFSSLADQKWKVLARNPIGTALCPVEETSRGIETFGPGNAVRPKISWGYDKNWREEDEKKGGPNRASLEDLDDVTEAGANYFSPPSDRT
jgi:hypothetical protein